MGKARDLLMQRYGVKPDGKSDEEVHDELLLQLAEEGNLPPEYQDDLDEIIKKSEKKQ